jgi:hypothetical protein
MITEIVQFAVPADMSREEIVANFEATAPLWHDNPDLLRKNYLLDLEARTAGGVYLWKTRADAEKWHGAAFRDRVRRIFGSEPVSVFFETPVVVDNVAGAIVKA